MTTAVQHRRGTTAEHSTFTGLEGEVTIDTTKDTAVIHDGVLAGGYPLAKENLANVTTSGLSSIDGASTASDDKFFIYDQSATTLKTITRAELNNAIEQDALANVAITGGTINGTAIGGSTAAAGSFTTLSASGALTYGGVTLSNAVTGTGNMVLSNSPTLVTPALGTPSSGVVTNLTGTASININGTVGATTANTGAFTTLTTSGAVTHNAGTANGVAYLNGSKVLTTGSALTFDGSNLAVGQASVTAGSMVQVNGALLASNVVTTRDTTNLGVQIGGGGTVAAGGASTVAGIYADINGFGGASDLIIRPRSDGSAGALRVFTGTGGGSERYKIQSDGQAVWTIGSEQMRLTSTGLGIGTTTPGVFGVTAKNVTVANSAGYAYLQLQGSSANGGAIDFGDASVRHAEIASLSGSQLAFYLNTANSGNSISEQMRLTSTGLGIGTSSPSVRLHANVNSASEVDVARFQATNGSDVKFLDIGVDTTNNFVSFDVTGSSSGAYVFRSGGTERMRLSADGNLGLGVTPSAWSGQNAIQFNYGAFSAGTAIGTLMATNSFYNGTNWIYRISSTAMRYTQDSAGHYWHTAPSGTAGNAISFTQAMTLTAAGDLGVGTTSPAQALEVNRINATGFAGVRINNPSGANGAGVATGLELYNASNFGFQLSSFRDTNEVRLNIPVSGAMTFLTNNTERARISAGGNFSIGTTSALGRLTVDQGTDTNGIVLAYSGRGASRIDWELSGVINENCAWIHNNGTNRFVMQIMGRDNVIWNTNNTERARIDSSGNLLVGTTTSQGTNGFSFEKNGTAPRAYVNKTFSGTASAWYFMHNSSVVGSIDYSNTATAYVTTSDHRLKENVRPMTGALDKVAALKPCTYKWKADGSDGEGFIAHELAEVCPQAVSGEKDAVDADGKPVYQGIDTSFLVATLTAAIQEQQAIINAQETALNQLKAQLTSVSEDVAALKGA